MRILHVIPSIALEYGGPSHAVRLMARAVVERGASVDVATSSQGTPQGGADPRRVWEYDEAGVGYRLFPQLRGSRWGFSVSLTRWLFARVRDYDVLHIHGPFSYSTLPACAAARKAGVPYVYRPIGALDRWSLKQKAWKKWPYYYLLERRNLLGASFVHVTSNAERQAVEVLGVTREKTALIPLGVPSALKSAAIATVLPLRVLFIGRLHPKKGIPLLIDAVATLRSRGEDVVLDIAGSGDAAYAASLREHARKVGLESVVTFAGFVTGERKAELFAAAHVVALPSYDENFGISVVEAMSVGLPVVLSDAVGIADDVRKAGAGRVCRAGDVGGLTQSLAELLPATERRACSERALGLVAAEFSIDAMAERLMGLYERVGSAPAGEGDRPAAAFKTAT